jgi:hypothetical protein
MSALYKSASDNILPTPLTDRCIVLDLDETLVHSNEKLDDLQMLKIMTDPNLLDIRNRTYQITMDDVVYKKGTGAKTIMWGIVKPHVKEFLISCFSYFKVVIVWSAGKRRYVEAIVDHLFKDIRRPHIVYTYDDCEKTPEGLLVKPLHKMIEKESGLNKYMGLHNSFIIDDRDTVYKGFSFTNKEHKEITDNPYNGIQIPAYKPEFNYDDLRKDDVSLKQLMSWLLDPDVINVKDVRELDKNNIFNKDINTDFPYPTIN